MECASRIRIATSLSLICCLIGHVYGHGRLIDPPSRASMWRYGWSTPHNYNDNQLFCGGVHTQWDVNGGKCGICGDPWQGPREHEAGGKFATGMLVKNYKQGQVITVVVQLTANHKGYFEFRICKNNNPKKPATHHCLDKHLLKMETGETRFMVSGGTGYGVSQNFSVKLQLPPDLKCTQCVLQWKYNAGNSWGTDLKTGQSGIGYGAQEQFYGCADVSIGYEDVVKVGMVPKVFLCLLEEEIEEGWARGRAPPFDEDEERVCGSSAHSIENAKSIKILVTFVLIAISASVFSEFGEWHFTIT